MAACWYLHDFVICTSWNIWATFFVVILMINLVVQFYKIFKVFLEFPGFLHNSANTIKIKYSIFQKKVIRSSTSCSKSNSCRCQIHLRAASKHIKFHNDEDQQVRLNIISREMWEIIFMVVEKLWVEHARSEILHFLNFMTIKNSIL